MSERQYKRGRVIARAVRFTRRARTHPKYIGHRSRIVVLRELIEYISARPDVWFGTHEAAVRWVRQQAGMDPER